MDSDSDTLAGGLPHSEIPGSTIARISPGLFAACHVLHRLSVPRHPPDALTSRLSPHPTANATSGEALLRRPTGKTQAFCRKGARHCERNGVGRVSTPDLIRGPWRRSKALRSMPPSEYGISQRRHLESLSSQFRVQQNRDGC